MIYGLVVKCIDYVSSDIDFMLVLDILILEEVFEVLGFVEVKFFWIINFIFYR